MLFVSDLGQSDIAGALHLGLHCSSPLRRRNQARRKKTGERGVALILLLPHCSRKELSVLPCENINVSQKTELFKFWSLLPYTWDLYHHHHHVCAEGKLL